MAPRTYYVRYMDDILVLTKTRWQLRRGRAQVEPDLRRTESLAAPPTRPSSGASSEALIFLAITSAVARYGSRSERFRITRHGFIGFMSNRIQHPQVPFVWMST